jgi:hypothetical protein
MSCPSAATPFARNFRTSLLGSLVNFPQKLFKHLPLHPSLPTRLAHFVDLAHNPLVALLFVIGELGGNVDVGRGKDGLDNRF